MKEINMEDVKEFVDSYLKSAEMFANTREEVEKVRVMKSFLMMKFMNIGIVGHMVSLKKLQEQKVKDRK